MKRLVKYPEKEVLELLNKLNDLLEEKQYISDINEGIISISDMSNKEIEDLNDREAFINSISNNEFKIDITKWFKLNKKK